MAFQKAVKHEAKLRLAIAGPSGSGKTYTSLAIATALANGGKVALVDTEHGSASKYADLFDFDVMELAAPFHPDRFCEAIREAGRAGYSVLVLDSLTHAWSGAGGLLEIVDSIAVRMKTTNTFAAWKDATPIQNRLVEAIVAASLHIIATMRSKQDYVLTQDDRGKSTIRKVGMAPQQREGFEYEFDVFMDMDMDNTGIVQKTRCPDLTGGVFKKPGADVADILARWLQGVPSTIQTRIIVDQPPTNGAQAMPTNGHNRPWDVETAVAKLREFADRTRNSTDAKSGEWGALIGLLDSKPFDTALRHVFLKAVYGVESSKDMTGQQRYALLQWAKPARVDGQWCLDGNAVAEYRAIVNQDRPATDPDGWQEIDKHGVEQAPF